MSKKIAPPPVAFVNLQPSSVTVADESRRPLTVSPWEARNRHRDATFVVYGEFYRQFVSPAGPLYPFPGDPMLLTKEGCEQGRGVDPASTFPPVAALRPQQTPPPARVPSAGTAGRKAWVTQIREEMRKLGIGSPSALMQSSAAQLFESPMITMDTIKDVREAAAEIFATFAPPPAQPAAEEADEESDDPASAGDAAGGDAPTKLYSRAAIAAMSHAELLAVVDAEGFEIKGKIRSGKTPALREHLLEGLDTYKQLVD